MKKIMIIIVCIATLTSLLACDRTEEGYRSYEEGGICFILPDTLKRLQVSSDYVYYTDGNMKAIFYYYSNSTLDEYGLGADITVTDYALLYQSEFGYYSKTSYDSLRGTVQYDEIRALIDESGVTDMYEYVLHIRAEHGIYDILLTCSADKRDEFKPIFEKIDASVKLK